MFEFNITYSEDDYFKLDKYNVENNSSYKKARLICYIVTLMLSFVVICKFYIIHNDIAINLWYIIAMMIPAILCIIGCKRIILFFDKKKTEIKLKSGAASYSYNKIIKCDDEFIYEITPETEMKMSYLLIDKIAVSECAVYIYTSLLQTYIIPIRLFSNKDEMLKLVGFLNKKITDFKDNTSAV